MKAIRMFFIRMKVLFNRFFFYMRWPNWYFFGALIALFVLSVEIVSTWLGFGYLMLGFAIWSIKKVNS